MTRGCGGTLSSVVHAFGPSFPTIPPRASHYSRHEKRCPLVFQLSPFNHDRCQVQFKSFLECLLASPGTLVNEFSNDRIFFEDSLPVNVQSHCPEILALYSSHSSSRSFFQGLRGSNYRFERFRRLPSSARRSSFAADLLEVILDRSDHPIERSSFVDFTKFCEERSSRTTTDKLLKRYSLLPPDIFNAPTTFSSHHRSRS